MIKRHKPGKHREISGNIVKYREFREIRENHEIVGPPKIENIKMRNFANNDATTFLMLGNFLVSDLKKPGIQSKGCHGRGWAKCIVLLEGG